MTPERAGAGLQGNPVLHIQVIAEARVMMDGAAQPPGSLFRPWDTPESLSPTSSEKTEKSLSPSSSNLLSSNSNSPTISNPQSLSPTTSNPQPENSGEGAEPYNSKKEPLQHIGNR